MNIRNLKFNLPDGKVVDVEVEATISIESFLEQLKVKDAIDASKNYEIQGLDGQLISGITTFGKVKTNEMNICIASEKYSKQDNRIANIHSSSPLFKNIDTNLIDEFDLLFENIEEYVGEGELSDEAKNEVGNGNNNIGLNTNRNVLISLDRENDTTHPCPSCYTEIDPDRYGKISCLNCGFVTYRRNPKVKITQFETIEDKKLANEYLNVIARINNNFIKKNYEEAFKHCKKAEEIAPREPTTWEFYTLTEFYYQRKTMKKIDDIIISLRYNIEICKANDVCKEKIEEIKGLIAIHLFQLSKSKIGFCYAKSKIEKGFWAKKGRANTIQCLYIFVDCFKLTKELFYLKEYVNELGKPYKWIVKNLSDEIVNLPSCGKKFNAVANREKIIKKIQKINTEYIPPDVEPERLNITTEEFVKQG